MSSSNPSFEPKSRTKSSKSEYKPFAEVIESSLDSFLAQCWKWNQFPQFGSLVQVDQDSRIIFGCVTQITTGSIDPTRYPFPYQKTEKELLAEQPQIFELLKTTFKVQIIGYQEDETIFYVLPTKPCKIHSFVQDTPHKNIVQFFSRTDFLYLLFAFAHQIPNIDELLLAIVKELIGQNIFSTMLLENFCQTFSLLTGNDYRRLKLFIKRIEALQALHKTTKKFKKI
jgi:hypothetical protein